LLTALRALRPSWCARTYFGARIQCSPNDLIQRMILHFGVWEPDVSRVIERSLGAGDVFVDVGANIGYHSLLALSRVRPGGRVVAIEASPRTFALLQANLALNPDSSDVRAVNAAVSDRPGRLDLYEVVAGNIGAATTLASRGGTRLETVDALPLERILEPDEIIRLRLIKIDVEGAEPPILRHMLTNIASFPSTMEIVVEASPVEDLEAWRDVFGGFRAAGFTAWEIANDYSLEWYLRWRKPTALKRLDALPGRQHDLLFTRRQMVS
jgi:FkbM family methyltransferase